MKKHSVSRRSFLRSATAVAGACTIFHPNVLGANERVNIGIIGLGIKGGGHLKSFAAVDGVNVIAVCDPDLKHMEQAESGIARHQDLRRVFDMKDIDAVVIASPDHWHCSAAVMAFEAGKHAYVEKPVSQCVWEGRQMVKSARKHNRIVQAGTQHRSCPAVQECAKDIQSGKYGKVLWVHCSRLGSREQIGKVNSPVPVPDHIDYELWAGPAPKTPVMRKKFHYDWHWQWNWGTGEMGNWAVHYVDDVRHLLGWDDVPGNVVAAGNRWWDDDGETPNMIMALMNHRGVNVVIDVRNMVDPARGGKRGAVYLGGRSGNYIMCERGFIRISRGGGKAYDLDGKLIKQYKGDGGKDHIPNFINAIRNGSNKSLACEIEIGHNSTMMCHLANMGYQAGRAASPDEMMANVKGHEDAVNTLESILTQLGANKIDLKQKPMIVGPKLTFDQKSETFVGDNAAKANKFIRLERRKAFDVIASS